MRQSADEALRRVQYEAYGPGGTAVLIDCVTDDRERTTAEVRRTLESHGGLLGASGAIAYLFYEVGLIRYPRGVACEPIAELAVRAGAEDVVVGGEGGCEVLTDPRELEAIRARLLEAGFMPEGYGITRRAASGVRLGVEDAAELGRLLRALRETADVRSIYTNAQIPDEVLAEF